MTKQTLSTAVLNVVQTLKNVGAPFSAHDVTTVIRSAVNNGVYEISDVNGPRIPYRGGLVQSIEHAQVRNEVDNLFATGVLASVFGIQRKDNGTYQEYHFPQGTGLVASIATPVSPSPAASSFRVIRPISVRAIVPTRPTPLPRIESYVKSKGQRTLKQVQSALYPTKVTCDQLATLIQSSSKLSLSRASDLSKSLVVAI